MSQRRLRVSIIGSTGPDPRYRPGPVFGDRLAEGVCLHLNQGPASLADLAQAVGATPAEVGAVLERLLELRAVRPSGAGRFAINFPLLTRTDAARLWRQAALTAPVLAAAVCDHRREIYAALDRLLENGQPGNGPQLALATVGCFGLDWEGIATLKRLGHVTGGNLYPDGGRYVLTAEERGQAPPAKDYCGSHTGGGDHWWFTSFGDHSGPRHTLPDLLFRVEAALANEAWPEGFGPPVITLARHALGMGYDQCGEVLAGRRPVEGPGRRLLEAAGLLVDNRPAVPVFTLDALEPALDITGAVGRAVAAWAGAELESFLDSLSGLAPLQNRVPSGDFLNHAWHFVFASANRILAEGGFMLDPAPGAGGQGRYLSWVAQSEFYRGLWATMRVSEKA